MICPSCGGKFKVIDSRPDLDYTRRVRKCKDCGERYTTYEFMPDQLLDVFEEHLGKETTMDISTVLDTEMPIRLDMERKNKKRTARRSNEECI
jgi:transcriptional regulator NrdR family protein